MGNTEPGKETQKQSHRMTACCLAANPICLISHHLHQLQGARQPAREMEVEELNTATCHMLTACPNGRGLNSITLHEEFPQVIHL